MEQQRELRSRRKKDSKGSVIAAAVALAVILLLALTAVVYVQMGKKYRSLFFPNTTINGIDASDKTVEEVKNLISSGIDSYVLTIKARGDKTETIGKDDIGLYCKFDGTLEEIIAGQNTNEWLKHKKNTTEYVIDTMIAFDQEAFDQAVGALECLDEEKMIQPEDAHVSEYTPGQGYTIIPETDGTKADPDIVKEKIAEAVESLQDQLVLEDIGCYVKAAVTSEDETLKSTVQNLNQYVNMKVTYKFGDKQEVLDGDTIHQWISVNADSTIGLDTAQVKEFVKQLAKKYDTAYQPKTLKTNSGKTVRIVGGNYGWRINQTAETEALTAVLRSGESQTREPEYLQRAASHGENDYGNTYVEVNLTAQHLWFYKDGKMIAEADFVSGNESKGWATPAGAYPLTYKQRNATLKGENYATPVDYWMPFNGGIGLHDADWRNKFGGAIYKTNGSHGCVNLPPPVAKTIYENIAAGDPVLCYHLEGSESKGTSASTPPAATTAATQPQTTPA
ncbi:MAG: L,D-transpeptidase/peptidoglycan binding protein, partial [Clostridiaceae bacterium]|nr:L,D-transpeptidase/peptidoglycan binding protein [Clostridiaceae bacterium]